MPKAFFQTLTILFNILWYFKKFPSFFSIEHFYFFTICCLEHVWGKSLTFYTIGSVDYMLIGMGVEGLQDEGWGFEVGG